MKLDIKNFICFNNYSLTLPDNGLVLLKGDSGAGKTTLLKAIVYALWGRIPSQGKILTFNAKRAYVRLEYKNLVIERWTNPKHFQLTIINDSILTSIPDLKSGTTQQNEKDKHIKVKNNTGKYILKNAEAQDHIRETIRFGEEVFGYSSWVPQKSSSSILTETPAKQLEIIRTLSIGPHISRLKAMQLYLKTTIADLLSSFERTRGRLDVQVEEFETLEEPEKPDISEKELEILRKSLKNLKERKKALEKHKFELIQRIGSLHEKFKRAKKVKIDVSLLKDELSAIREELKYIYERLWDEAKYSKFQDELELSEQEVEYHRNKQWRKEIDGNYNRVRNKIQEYNEVIASETITEIDVENAKEVVDSIDLSLEDALLQQVTIEQWNRFFRKTHNQRNNDLNIPTPINLKNKLLQLQKKTQEDIDRCSRSLEQDNNDYTKCPECKIDLVVHFSGRYKLQKAIPLSTLERNKLEKWLKELKNCLIQLNILLNDEVWVIPQLNDTIKLDITRIKQTIEEFREHKELASMQYKELISELGRIREKYQQMSNLTDELERLETERSKEVYMIWKSWKSQFHSLKDAKAYNKMKEERVAKQQRLQTGYDRKNDIFIQKKEMLKIFENELAETKENSEQTLEKCQQRYTEVTNNYDDTSRRYSERKKRIHKAENEYLVYRNFERKIEKLHGEIEESKRKRKELEEDIREWELLLEYIKSSERNAIELTMELFNRYISKFLGLMFTGDNMVPTVYLEWGENQKIKTSYWYQGSEYSSIREFSGGEMDRLLLASVLTWNSIYESDLLFLDESLSSLDGTNNTDILISLRDTFQKLGESKLILVCSHEALMGVFDHIHFLETE